MAKLYFRYGAMGAGKSTMLMQVAHNYEEKGLKVLVVKPSLDTKGEDRLVSRIGIERKVDILLKPNELLNHNYLYNLADSFEELITICKCGKKARFNARKVDGKYTLIGDDIVIDGAKNIEYEALCGKCFLEDVVKV